MKKHLILKKLSLFISMFLIVLGGCSIAPNIESHYTPYTSGTLQGKGIRIEAEDGTFIIEEGRFTPPFQTYHADYGMRTISFATNSDGTSTGSLLDSVNIALNHGAKRVKVYHPATKQALYGVLLLNKSYVNSTGPAARSYLIRIPDSYVHNAKGGRVSVVYEPVSDKYQPKFKYIGWALWLSDTPF